MITPRIKNIDSGQANIRLDMIFQGGVEGGNAPFRWKVLIERTDRFGNILQPFHLLIDQKPVQGGQLDDTPDGHGNGKSCHGQYNKPDPYSQITVVRNKFCQ